MMPCLEKNISSKQFTAPEISMSWMIMKFGGEDKFFFSKNTKIKNDVSASSIVFCSPNTYNFVIFI